MSPKIGGEKDHKNARGTRDSEILDASLFSDLERNFPIFHSFEIAFGSDLAPFHPITDRDWNSN